VVGALCVLGIAGNVLSIVVLGRDQTIRRTTAFLLQMLAVADTIYLVSCLVVQTLDAVVVWTDWLPTGVRRGWPYVEAYAWPLASVAKTATVWLVVVLTADRYVAICRPLHAAQYSTVARVRTAVAAVWIVAAVYNLPRFFERVVVVVTPSQPVKLSSADLEVLLSLLFSTPFPGGVMDHASSSDLPSTTLSPGMIGQAALRKTAMRSDSTYFLVYKTLLYFVVRFLVPFAALAFFNQRLIAAMRASNELRQRSAAAGGGAKERQHTWILVVVVVVFVVCELPDLTLRASVAIDSHVPGRLMLTASRVYYANIFSNLMLTVNSCINFVIYCLMGRRFRLILVQMIGCGR